MKLNLSRAAKKFREEPKTPAAPKPVVPKKTKAPAVESVKAPVVETVEPEVKKAEPVADVAVEPVEAAPPPEPKKVWPAKAKRPRFVRVPGEKRERVGLPPLPPPSTKFTAKLMTKNLAVPPKDD